MDISLSTILSGNRKRLRETTQKISQPACWRLLWVSRLILQPLGTRESNWGNAKENKVNGRENRRDDEKIVGVERYQAYLTCHVDDHEWEEHENSEHASGRSWMRAPV